MSENTLFSPEGVDESFSFQIGENKFGFKGGLTEGKFSGIIQGTDGQEFAGLVEDLGGGRYKVEDWESGRMFEPLNEQPAPAMADMPVGGLEDATALVAMEAAAVEQTVVEPQSVPEKPIVEIVTELPTVVAEATPVKEPEPAIEAVQLPVSEPPALAPEPEQIQIQESKSGDSTEKSSTHPTISNAVNHLQEIRREVAPQAEEAKRLLAVEAEARNLRQQAENARGSLNRLRNKDRISEKIAEEGALIRQAKELEDKVGVARSQDKYKEMDEHKAWRLEARRDATIALETDLKQWEAVMKNPEDFNFYRQIFEKWQKERGKAGNLTGQVDQKFRPLLDEFEQRLPRRLLDLAGLANPRPEGGQKGVDDDIWAIYNQATSQLYSELGGQPAATAELPVAPVPDLLPEQVVTEPVAEITTEPIVEEPAEPVVEVTPQPVVEPAPAAMEENLTEVTVPAAAEETAPPEPIEAPVETPLPGDRGQVVVDAEEQARVAEMPVQAPMPEEPDVAEKTGTVAGDAQKGIGQFTEGLNASFEDKAREYADRISAGENPATHDFRFIRSGLIHLMGEKISLLKRFILQFFASNFPKIFCFNFV